MFHVVCLLTSASQAIKHKQADNVKHCFTTMFHDNVSRCLLAYIGFSSHKTVNPIILINGMSNLQDVDGRSQMGRGFPGIEASSSTLRCKFPPFSAKSVHLSVNLP